MLDHRLDRSAWRAVAFAAALAFAAPAGAANYQYASGSATVTASISTGPIGNATLQLNGLFAEFDKDTGILSDFNFTTVPNQWINLNAVYGGFNQVWVDNASVVPGVGYHSLGMVESPPGSGHWSISVVPVVVNATYTGKNSLTLETSPPFPLSYTNTTPLNAIIDVIDRSFTLQGITLGVVPLVENNVIVDYVTVNASITFQGATPVPEPAAFGLIALAGLALAISRSRA